MSRRKKPFPFFLWHRRIGLLAMILVFILSVTGIMLNHTEGLKLDEITVESDLILDWYDINPDGKPISYASNQLWVSQWNHQLFFNGKNIYSHDEQLRGFAQLDNIIAIALQHNVLLLDEDGEIIELISLGIDSDIARIGISNNRIALLDNLNNYYLSDKELSQWKPEPPLATEWSQSTNLTNDQLTQLKHSFRGQGLNLERVILDLHSGRIFNASWGIYIMDASAILMIFLGISGLWVWWSRKLKLRSKRHYQKHH